MSVMQSLKLETTARPSEVEEEWKMEIGSATLPYKLVHPVGVEPTTF